MVAIVTVAVAVLAMTGYTANSGNGAVFEDCFGVTRSIPGVTGRVGLLLAVETDSLIAVENLHGGRNCVAREE